MARPWGAAETTEASTVGTKALLHIVDRGSVGLVVVSDRFVVLVFSPGAVPSALAGLQLCQPECTYHSLSHALPLAPCHRVALFQQLFQVDERSSVHSPARPMNGAVE